MTREAISLAADLVGLGVDVKGWLTAIGTFIAVGGFALREGFVLLAVIGAPAAGVLCLFIYQFWRWKDFTADGVPPSMVLSRLGDPKLVERRDSAFSELHYLEARLYVLVQQIARRNRKVLQGKGPANQDDLDGQRDELLSQREMAEVQYSAANNALVNDVYGQLFGGKLVAHGFALPHAHGQPARDIPRLEWDFLRFGEDLSNVSGNGVQYHVVSIRRA